MKLLEAALNEHHLQQSGRHLQNQVSPNVLPMLSQLQDHLCHKTKQDKESKNPGAQTPKAPKGTGKEARMAAVGQVEGSSALGMKPPAETSKMSDMSEPTKRRYRYTVH